MEDRCQYFKESTLSAFLVTVLYFIYLDVILAYHIFPALAEYQPKVYSTLLFCPATQTCCSEGEDGLEFFDEEF
jgi:hypothetical protein